jgi:ATP-binding cassette subfamily B protein
MPKANLVTLLKPYRFQIGLLVLLTLLSNGLNLAVPKIISKTIDSFAHGTFVLPTMIIEFLIVGVGIFIFTYLQSVVQTYALQIGENTYGIAIFLKKGYEVAGRGCG